MLLFIKKTRWLLAAVLLLLLYVSRYAIIFKLQYAAYERVGAVQKKMPENIPAYFNNHAVYKLKGNQKLWPHRVNTIKYLSSLYPFFNGFETDIQVDEKQDKLLIGHDAPAADSLQLEAYFSQADYAKKLFWLDVKNLDSTNISFFIAKLNVLDRLYQVKNRIIVETANFPVFKDLYNAGYLASYYYTPGQYQEQVTEYGSQVRQEVETHAGLVSADYLFISDLQKLFPGKHKITWDVRFLNSFRKSHLQQTVEDNTILVCLINIKNYNYSQN